MNSWLAQIPKALLPTSRDLSVTSAALPTKYKSYQSLLGFLASPGVLGDCQRPTEALQTPRLLGEPAYEPHDNDS